MKSLRLKQFQTPEKPFYLIALIITVQVFYWFLLTPLFQSSPIPYDRYSPTSLEVAVIDAPDWAKKDFATFEAFEPPYRSCCEAGYRLAKITFDLDDIPEQGVGEVPIIGATNYQTRLNGTLIWAEGTIELDNLTAHGRVFRGINRLPAGLLKTGENELSYMLTAAPGTGGFHIGYPNLGEYQQMVARFDFRRFLLNDYGLISYTIGYVVAFLAFIAWLRGGRQPYVFWLAFIAFIWSSRLYYQTWDEPIVGGQGLATIGSLFAMALPLAWLNLTNHMAGRPLRWVFPASLIMFVIAMVLSVFDIWMGTASRSVERIGYWFIGAGALASAVLLLRNLSGLERQYYWEFAIYLTLVLILVRDSFTRLVNVLGGVETDFVLPFFLIALVAAFIARNIQLFRSKEQLNKTLQTELEERTAELEQSHEREKQFLRQQAHQDERQRIMMDMHDGLGSSLMSMMLAARRGKMTPSDIDTGLQAVFDEMRLMVDSMDSVGETLAAALTLFRERAQSRVTNNKLNFVWNNEAQHALPNFESRVVLQIFRILQEAITNALKHSDGDTVSVDITNNEIRIRDNGKTFSEPRVGGRGLGNMKARATSIGADFSVMNDGQQTCVTLSLPLQESVA